MCGGGAIHTSCGFWCRHTCFPSEGRKGRLVLLAAPTLGATLRVAQTFGLTPSWGRRGDQTVRRVFLLGPTGPIGIRFLAAHCWPLGPTIPPPRTRRICGRMGGNAASGVLPPRSGPNVAAWLCPRQCGDTAATFVAASCGHKYCRRRYSLAGLAASEYAATGPLRGDNAFGIVGRWPPAAADKAAVTFPH